MTDNKSTIVTFERVQEVASQMLHKGLKLTVRGVANVTGGRNENVAKYLNEFNTKRDLEVSKLADELGSSEIGKLLASEIENVVGRRNASLLEIKERQADEIQELLSLLSESELSCKERIDDAEAESARVVAEANSKTEKALTRVSEAESKKVEIEDKFADLERETLLAIRSSEDKSRHLVEAAKSEAKSLVGAAEKQTQKAEDEAISLREQVKLLSIDQARREIEKDQFEQMKVKLEEIQTELAESKTEGIRNESLQMSADKDITRLTNELTETKQMANKLPQSQAELIEAQKRVTQLSHDLSQSEKMKESFSRALAVSEKNQAT